MKIPITLHRSFIKLNRKEKYMKVLEKLRLKIGLWLIQTKAMTATEMMLRDRVNQTRCIHCGKNPYFKENQPYDQPNQN